MQWYHQHQWLVLALLQCLIPISFKFINQQLRNNSSNLEQKFPFKIYCPATQLLQNHGNQCRAGLIENRRPCYCSKNRKQIICHKSLHCPPVRLFWNKKLIYFYYSTFVIVFILLSLFSLMNNCQEKGQDRNCKYTDYPVRLRSIFHKNLFKILWRSYQKGKFYAIKPNSAFNSCSFLKGKETWKTTWKKK